MTLSDDVRETERPATSGATEPTDAATGSAAEGSAAAGSAAEDSAATDSAATDSAATDSAATDSAATDTAATDATATDSAATDTAATDATATDGPPAETPAAPDLALLEQEGEVAADYLEGLLDIVDLDGDLDMDVEGDRAVVAILGSGLERLVGPNGETLDALQELTRLAVHQSTSVRSRLMLDIGGHRSRRRAALTELGRRTAESVVSSGERATLDPMTPFERKVVHDAVAAVAGARSESEGVEPARFVVVLPD